MAAWWVHVLLLAVADAILKGSSLEGRGHKTGLRLRALHGKSMADAEELSLDVTLEGQDLKLNLTSMPSTTRHARITVERKNGSEELPVPRVVQFKCRNGSAVLTFVGQGFTALVKHNGRFYDVTTVRGSLRNGTVDIEAHEAKYNHSVLDKVLIPNLKNSTKGRQVSEARKLQWSDDLDQWTDCYSQDYVTRSLAMGVALGSKFFSQKFFTTDEAVEWVAGNFAKANLVYEQQLNFKLDIGHLYIAGYSGSPSWDQGPSCAMTIDEQLHRFTEWEPPSEQGLWHLFDDCAFVHDNTIGLAWTGTLCDNDVMTPSNFPDLTGRFNKGVSWYTTAGATWLTFAHEVGHNFGAQHSFENGQGTTGGIMDYGDGTLEGVYQFNTEFRKAEMCETIQTALYLGCPYINYESSTFASAMLEMEPEGQELQGTLQWLSENGSSLPLNASAEDVDRNPLLL